MISRLKFIGLFFVLGVCACGADVNQPDAIDVYYGGDEPPVIVERPCPYPSVCSVASYADDGAIISTVGACTIYRKCCVDCFNDTNGTCAVCGESESCVSGVCQ